MFENISRRFSDIVAGIRGRKITESNIKDTVREIRVALLEADVALPVVKDFIAKVQEKALGAIVVEGVDSGQQFIKAVNDELAALMGPVQSEISWRKGGPTVILLAGLQGSGKTTTCGKLALYLRDKKHRRPLMVAADIQRPAAIEQLKTLGAQLEIPVFHQPGLTPPQICEQAVKKAASLGCDTVLLDTAGRLHIDAALMDELKQVARLTNPDEIFLVCDAMTGQDAVNSAREFNAALELSGLILTKLDGDARGGAALSVKYITGKTIRFVGVGEKLDRLDEFHPDRMAQRILGMGDIVSLVERAQEKIDVEHRQAMEESLREGTFNLEHFLQQMQQMKKMGSMRDLLSHIPGLGAHVDEIGVDDKDLVGIESIIQSMTRSERERPEIINTGRRRRIANGCGRSIEDVNDLLKQFKMMKGVMDEMAGYGKGFIGKMRGLRAMQKKMKSGGMMGPPDMPSPPRALAPGMAAPQPRGPSAPMPSRHPSAADQNRANRQPIDRDQLRKKKKAERQRKRKGRQR